MGQAEIIECLSRHEEAIPRRQIVEETGLDPIAVSHLLSRLIKFEEVKFQEIDKIEAKKSYNICRKMMLFFLPKN